jgi:hypothetical protein
MANVTAVSMATTKPKTGIAGFWGIMGAIWTLAGLANIGDKGLPILLWGLLVGGVSLVWLRSRKPTYSVHLGSASGETKAMRMRERRGKKYGAGT